MVSSLAPHLLTDVSSLPQSGLRVRANVKDGKLIYGYNYVADQRFKVEATNGGIAEGDHVVSFEFTPTGKPDLPKAKGVPANVKLFVDGTVVSEGDLPVTIPIQLGLGAGADTGSPVMLAEDYEPPFAFTGTIKKALVDVSGEPIEGALRTQRP